MTFRFRFSGSRLGLFVAAGLLVSHESRAQDPIVVHFDEPTTNMTITDLRRTDDGTTLTLHGSVTNTAAKPLDLGYTFDMYLVDFKNRQKYLVIQDSAAQCLCSPNGTVQVPPSGNIHIWAKFAAAPASVTSLSFGWGRAEPVAVPITQ